MKIRLGKVKFNKSLLKKRYFKVFVFLLVLYFTFVLRAHNYERVPDFGHLEEMLYGWSGIYLIETGVPVSWSTLDYPGRTEIFRGILDYKGGAPYAPVRLYKPWLDEPPLFSLLVGWFAHLYNADRNQVIPAAYLRFPVIFISTITSILTFLVAKKVSGFWTGILSMLIYGVTPIMVFGSRMAVPENLIACILMLVILLIIYFYETLKVRYILPIPILIGVAGLSKPTGFFLLPLVVFMVFAKKYYKLCVYLILATIPFILAFFVYGLYYDSEVFWRILNIQSYRPVGFSSLAYFFTSPAFDISILNDSWYVFCLLSAIFFIFMPKNGLEKFISLSFVYWIIIVMISGGEADLLPWYRYPVFPLLSIIGAWGLQYLIRRADFFSSFIIIGMLLGSRFLLVNAFRPNIQPLDYRLLFSSLMLPSVFHYIYPQKWLQKLNKLLLIIIIIVGLYFNSKYIYNRFDLVCENVDCPLGPTTNLSGIHFPIIWRFFVLGEHNFKF